MEPRHTKFAKQRKSSQVLTPRQTLFFRFRNTGIGVCSMMAPCGSIITPFIVLSVCTFDTVNSLAERTTINHYTRAFRIELEFRNVGFCGEGKTGVPGARKTSRSREENQQQTQPTYDVESANRTRATLVEGECSHHCAIPAPPHYRWHYVSMAPWDALQSHGGPGRGAGGRLGRGL